MTMENSQDQSTTAHMEIRNLTMAYGSFVIQRDLTFTIGRGEIFIIMGGSGCGKSTLLKHLIGLKAPAKGEVLFDGHSLWRAEPEDRARFMRRFGILYQKGALWTSLTLERMWRCHLSSTRISIRARSANWRPSNWP